MSRVGRPARTPDYRLSIGSEQITPRVRGRLQSLTLTDRRGLEADQLELVLTDDDGQLALPRRGVEIHAAIGWRGGPLIDRGTYTVDEIEHTGAPDTLSIRASSADFRGQFPVKRTQSWHRTTLGDIVATLAKRHGLKPGIAQALHIIGVKHIDQTDESDVNFLTRLAERHDAIVTVKGGHLLFIPAGHATTASGIGIPPIVLQREDGDQHRYSVTDRDSYSGVTAAWHDTESAERRNVIAGSSDNPKRLRPIYASEEDAFAAAKGEWQRLQRGAAEFGLSLADGRPDIYPETPVTLRGWKRGIDDTRWILTEVSHEIGDGGYTSTLKMEVAEKN